MQSITATIYLDGQLRTITINPKTQTLTGLIYMSQYNDLHITQYNYV
jgi:hypothetical protein